MPTPHKYAEVIKAWADGATVQRRSWPGEGWNDIGQFPSFDAQYEWRVKPHQWQAEMDAHKAGKAVQCRVAKPGRDWCDLDPGEDADWDNPHVEFRIKPEVLRYKRWLARYPTYEGGARYYVYIAHENDAINRVAEDHRFVKWVDTEWQEVEVPA